MYKKCKTYKEKAECVKSLVDNCFKLKNNFNFPLEDIRNQTLNNIEKIAVINLSKLNFLDSWVIGGVQQKYFIRRLIGLLDDNMSQDVLRGWDKISKLSFVLLCQFQIENCVSTLNKSLSLKSRGGFYNEAEALILFLSLPKRCLKMLNVPALIRNTLHNNGIHNSSNQQKFCIIIRSVNYSFSPGRHISCATWEHIAHVLENSVVVLERIFNHKKIKALNSPIISDATKESLAGRIK